MYKKITHNIVEEHFGSESLARKMLNFQQPKPMANNELASQLKMQVRDGWGKICNTMRENIIGIVALGEDQTLLHDKLMKEVDDLTSTLTGLYGKTATDEASKLLKALLHSEIMIIKNTRANRDTKEYIASLDAAINDFSQFLGVVNSIDWPPSVVKSIFSSACESWTGQATARMKKDWVADFELDAKVRRLIVSNPDQKNPSFADIMSHGIIRQFPMVFTDATNQI